MRPSTESPHTGRIIGWGITGFLVLLGVAIVLSSVFRGSSTGQGTLYYPSFPFFPFGFGWLWGIFWIFIVFWMVRRLFWPWGRRYSRRYWRGGDGAYSILRERYAKGEITKEQFDQMMKDLEVHS
jgi:putative membrane protein